MSLKDMVSIMKEYFSSEGEKSPLIAPPHLKVDSLLLANSIDDFSFVWFGHSTFFIKMGTKNILLDPMFSEVPAPHPALGKKTLSEGATHKNRKFNIHRLCIYFT